MTVHFTISHGPNTVAGDTFSACPSSSQRLAAGMKAVSLAPTSIHAPKLTTFSTFAYSCAQGIEDLRELCRLRA
jgi:hypothetical protein